MLSIFTMKEEKKEAGSFKHTQTHIRTSIMFHFKYTGAKCICEWIIKGGGLTFLVFPRGKIDTFKS